MGLADNNVHLDMERLACYNAVVEMNSDRLKGSNI